MQVGWSSLLIIAGGFALFFSGTPAAEATSTTRASISRETDCKVAAEFLGATPKRNRVVWRYHRTDTSESAACRKLSEEFEVWIPGGAYSTLSESIVYPAHIVEPKPGQKFTLLLIFAERPSRGWFFSGPHPLPEENRK